MDKEGYEHLPAEERAVSMVERRRSSSFRAIATLLGRAPSTVSLPLTTSPVPSASAANPSIFSSTAMPVNTADSTNRPARVAGS